MELQTQRKKVDKGFTILFVRFLPFIITYHLYNVIKNAYDGIFIEDIEFILGNSAIYALAFLFISLSDSRYHCIWNRAMWCELIFVPTFNYIDSKYKLVTDVQYINIMEYSFHITMCATIILAIYHFLAPRIRNKLNN